MRKLQKVFPIAFFCIICLLPWNLSGQTRNIRKPQVLVYGNNIAAYTAAIQSAKSNLTTIWITGSEEILVPELTKESLLIESNHNMDAGIWLQLLQNSYKGDLHKDSVALIVKGQTNPVLLLQAMEDEIKKYPHLHLLHRENLTQIKKNKSDFKITTQKGQSWDVFSIIDASESQNLSQFLPASTTFNKDTNNPKKYRTSVGVIETSQMFNFIPLDHVIPISDNGNFLSIFQNEELKIPFLAQIGQTYGALAAYMSFFKKDLKEIDIREVQSELLQYQAILLPFTDIPPTDPNFIAIQKIGLTFDYHQDKNANTSNSLFHPEKTVEIKEIASDLREYYSRSQIWLYENPEGFLIMEDFISLIQQLSQKGKEVEGQIRNAWHTKYHFSGEFSLNQEVTHRQFAVIFDDYCKPFEIKIGLKGQVLR